MLTIKNTYNYFRNQVIHIVNNIHTRKHISRNIEDLEFRTKLIEYNTQRFLGCDPTICHAPTRSLYFGFNGIVTACCFNRQHILGKFPENTIEEIIHSERRNILQQHLDRIDFSLGCNYCKDFIRNGNYRSIGAYYADMVSAQIPEKKNIPTEMVFELDNSCNLKCEMCSAKFSSSHNGGKRIVAPYDSNDFIEQLKPFIPYLTTTKFMGGEPFMSEIYPRIWELIISLNPKCLIQAQSNGTILNDKIKTILHRGNFQIGLSIDTLNPERYEKIRNGAKIENTLKNLGLFKQISEKNGKFLLISACPMKENRFDIPELVSFCNRKNILINFNNVYTENFTLSELSIQELEELITYYKSNNKQGRTYISKNNHIAFSNLIRGVEYLKKEQCKRNEYLNELITFTRDEYMKYIWTITSKYKNIDTSNIEYLMKQYIPESFQITRKQYIYLTTEMTIDNIIKFINLPKDQKELLANEVFSIS